MSGWLERYRWWLVGIPLAALLIGIGYLINEISEDPAPLEIRNSAAPGDGSSIAVYVTGAVANPGVYTVPARSRLVDAIQAAGGHTSEANLEAVNLARLLHDEDQVAVPRMGEEASGAEGNLININSAPLELLDTLPGIGPVRAQNIVESRKSAGPFLSTDELINRDLIPRSVYDQIESLVTAGP